MFEKIKSFFGIGGTKMRNNILMQNSIIKASANGNIEIMNFKIAQWLSMYLSSCDPYVKKSNGDEELKNTLGLPASICAEFARLVTQECEITIVDPSSKKDIDENNLSSEAETRASFLTKQIAKFNKKLPTYVEYACAGGGVVFKPYITNDNQIAIDCSLADEFVPLAFNSEGKITKCAFSEDKTSENKYYHRVETHEFEKGKYIVTNKAYKSYVKNQLGKECPLSEVAEWAELNEEVTLENINSPLFAYFRIPIGNCIDTTSPLGMAVFSRAVPQILEADAQWENYLWEFDATQALIEVTKGTFAQDSKGDPIVPNNKERLFIISELEPDEDKTNFKEFAPQIREDALKAGLNTILQRIEFHCGLAYGTLSDPQAIEKTAEEIKTSRQRSYNTVHSIQNALDDALRDLIAAIDVYATLYNLAPKGNFEVKTQWDDSVLIDSEKERQRDKDDVRQGIMQKWEYRVKWYNESEEVAKERCGVSTFDDDPFKLNQNPNQNKFPNNKS